MPKSIHLICEHVGPRLKGLAVVDAKPCKGRDLPVRNLGDFGCRCRRSARRMDLLCRATKAAKSEFGGRVVRTELSGHLTHRGVPEIAIVFESRSEARDRKWRRASHGMAWTGGLVEMTYEFEMASAG